MTPEQFRILYPRVLDWVTQTLAEHSPKARSVASLGFKRLDHYFSAQTLATTKVIAVAHVPTPPLTQLGATGFDELEYLDAAGITYLDTFFVDQRYVDVESLHFHELIHVVQWRILGPQHFIAAYADGIERFGYRNSPLEQMAYGLEDRFKVSPTGFDAEQIVIDQLHR